MSTDIANVPAIVPSIDMPTRNYPLRNLNEPPVYVMGERQGQKVLPNPAGMSGQVPIPPPGNRALNYGMPGMGMPANPQAMLAQQNSNMDVLARRAQRDRGASMSQVSITVAAVRFGLLS